MTALDTAAQAIAGVQDRYWITEAPDGEYRVHDAERDAATVCTGTREQCQAWIDREAARACLLSVLPVSDEVVEAYERATQAYVDRETMLSAMQMRREGITAAIHAYTREGA